MLIQKLIRAHKDRSLQVWIMIILLMLVIVFDKGELKELSDIDYVNQNIHRVDGVFHSAFQAKSRSDDKSIRLIRGDAVGSYSSIGEGTFEKVKTALQKGDRVFFGFVIRNQLLGEQKYLVYLIDDQGKVLVDEKESVKSVLSLYSPKWHLRLKILLGILFLLYLYKLFKGINNE